MMDINRMILQTFKQLKNIWHVYHENIKLNARL